MVRRRTLVVLGVVLLLALAGCSGLGDSQNDGPDAAGPAANGDAGAEQGSSDGASGPADASAKAESAQLGVQNRQLIRTGEVTNPFRSRARRRTASPAAALSFTRTVTSPVRISCRF